MKNKITISHSQLETLNQCQMKWYLEKVMRVKQAPNVNFLLGNAFHESVEAYGNMVINHHEIFVNSLADDLIDVAYNRMSVDLLKDDPDIRYISQTERDTVKRQLSTMLLAFVDHVVPTYQPLAVEHSFIVDLIPSVGFTGRIDAITAKAIVDFKTARSLEKWQHNGGGDSKPQATAYLVAASELAKQDNSVYPSQVTFLVFACDPSDPSHVEIQAFPTKRDIAQKKLWSVDATMSANAMLDMKSGISTPKHNTSPLCRWCGVIGSCDVGMSYVKRSGKPIEVPVTTNS